MWPFRKSNASRSGNALATIDRAIDFAAQRWLSFSATVALPPDMPLRDRIALFARSLDASLHGRFPTLAAAPEQVMLLIIAKGVQQSGAVPRREIERELGILLPP